MKKQAILLIVFMALRVGVTPSVNGQTDAALKANITKLKNQGLTGQRLQTMILNRANGLQVQNRPYVMNGTVDCWGYVRQTWNAILIDCKLHEEEYGNKSSFNWVNQNGGLLINDNGSADWQPINNDWSQLAPGVPLSSHQGHFGGGSWHGVIFVQAGQQYESTPVGPISGAGLRTRDAGMRYFYKPLNDLLKIPSTYFVLSPESEKQYIVEAGVKHWLMDGNEVIKRGGAGKMQTISKEAIDAIPTGIAYGTVIPTGNFRRIVFKANGDPNNTVYVVLDGKKRHLCRLPLSYNNIIYTGEDVEIVSAQAANAVPTGAELCPPVAGAFANGNYTIRLASGKALDADASKINVNGCNVQIWGFSGALNQQWILTNTGGDKYTLRLRANPNKALDLNGSNTANDGAITLWDYHGGANQQWILTPTGNGFYKIQSALAPNRVVDVTGVLVNNDGTKIHLWDFLNAVNQLWKIEPCK